MKITDVKAVYPNFRFDTSSWRDHFWQIVVRVDSDAGVFGYGYGGGGVGAVEVVNRHFKELVTGRSVDSVDDIRALWDDLYVQSTPYGRRGIVVMALSGLDLALWDLLGKAERKPVYELLGGARRDRVRAYASGGNPERYADMGYTAHKASTHLVPGTTPDQVVATVRRARAAFGASGLIMTDNYMSWDTDTTLDMAHRLADLDVFWFEDCLTPDSLKELADLRPRVKPVLLAGGEHEFTRFGFRQLAHSRALDLWQPDIAWCGGITEALRILELAREEGIPASPHRGGEIWGLHLMMATDCEDLAETHPDEWGQPYRNVWPDEPRAEDGYIAPTDRPGFGVTLNESVL